MNSPMNPSNPSSSLRAKNATPKPPRKNANPIKNPNITQHNNGTKWSKISKQPLKITKTNSKPKDKTPKSPSSNKTPPKRHQTNRVVKKMRKGKLLQDGTNIEKMMF